LRFVPHANGWIQRGIVLGALGVLHSVRWACCIQKMTHLPSLFSLEVFRVVT
jgi:hypothetical protein